MKSKENVLGAYYPMDTNLPDWKNARRSFMNLSLPIKKECYSCR